MFTFIFRTYYYFIFPYYFIGKTSWIFEVFIRSKKRLDAEILLLKNELNELK